jgi:transcription termination factor Rho
MNSASGYLEILPKGFGFLRNKDNNFRPSQEDAHIPAKLINQFQLREGLFIEGACQRCGEDSENRPQIIHISKINGHVPKKYSSVQELKSGVSINPDQRLTMTMDEGDRLGKVLDFVTPLGRGQRGLITAAPKTGKTTILKHIARAVMANHPDIKVFVLLVDERPEEVTDFRRSLPGATVLYSSADEDSPNHLRMTRMAMHCAMREAEFGADVIVLIDSLTRMARAFNRETDSFNRTMTGGLGANALELPRRFFGAARNIEKGGSLTIMATILVETGSRMDDIIFQEFKGTGNLDLVLSRACAERRVFPAVNLNASGTRKEELLLDSDDYVKIAKLRRYLAAQDEVQAMTYLMKNLDKI